MSNLDLWPIEDYFHFNENEFMKKINDQTYSDYVRQVHSNLSSQGINLDTLKKQGISGWVFVAISSALLYSMLGLFIAGHYMLIVSPLLGLIMAIHSQYLMHESTHNTLFSCKKKNRYAVMYSTAIVSYFEFFQYHKEHHANTNHIHKDLDYYNLGNLLGVTPGIKYRWWHKYPHILFYFGTPFLCVYNTLKRLIISPISAIKSTQKTKYKIFHLTVWFVFFALLNIYPFFVYGFTLEALYIVLVPRTVQWYIYINLFQWSHYHNEQAEGLKTYDKKSAKNFFCHILETTQNVCERSYIMRFLLVGNQIQHHLLPQVSGSKTHLLINITKAYAKDNGIQYHHSKSIWAQLVANYSFYKNRGAMNFNKANSCFKPNTLEKANKKALLFRARQTCLRLFIG